MDRPRLVPHRPFPPYAFTGDGFGFPHPRCHPEGHSYRQPEAIPEPLDPDRWRESEDYLFGIDLFNHGFYWEAHELWEGLWVAAGKKGSMAEFLKGLIKLTAAGVKARQENPQGVRKHAERAAEHFQETARQTGKAGFAGFTFAELEELSREIGGGAETWPSCPGEKVAAVFPKILQPRSN